MFSLINIPNMSVSISLNLCRWQCLNEDVLQQKTMGGQSGSQWNLIDTEIK